MAVTKNRKFDPNEIDFTGEYYEQLRNRYPEQTAVADAVENRNVYKRTGDAPTEEEIAETPAPEPRQTEVTQQGRVYKIQRGDTLSAIGKHFGVDWREIAKANGISNPNMIVAGKDLIIPGQGEITTSTTKSTRPSSPAKAKAKAEEPTSVQTQSTSRGFTSEIEGYPERRYKPTARQTQSKPTSQITSRPNSNKTYDRADVNKQYKSYERKQPSYISPDAKASSLSDSELKDAVNNPSKYGLSYKVVSNEISKRLNSRNNKPTTQKKASPTVATNKPKTRVNRVSELSDDQLRDALNHPSKYGLHVNVVNAEYKRRNRNYQYGNM